MRSAALPLIFKVPAPPLFVISNKVPFFCLVLLMQVFSDQLLLKDVLSRSDRALAVVQDLFGDGPHRKTGEYPRLLFHLKMT